MLISPSETFTKRSLQELEDKRGENRQVRLRGNLDTDGTDGARSVEAESEQLNPVREQEATEDQMEEQERSTSAIGNGVQGGLRPDVATETEKAEEEGEEGREAVAAPAPRAPSRLERDQHDLTHTPYRAWCPHCVRMRGRNTAHRQNVKREKIMDT